MVQSAAYKNLRGYQEDFQAKTFSNQEFDLYVGKGKKKILKPE